MMQREKVFAKQIFQWLLAGILAFGFLNLFVLFYHQTGCHIVDSSGVTDYKWEPLQWKTSCEEGFAFLRMDGNGYNNGCTPGAYEDIDVLIMGSSHMETLNIPQSRNVASLLNKLSPYYRTYSIGISGHTIYHCINNLGRAVRHFRPRRWVIIVVDSIELDEGAMNQVLANKWKRIPSYDRGALYFIQRSFPAVKELYKKLDDWHREKRRQN